MSKFVRKYRFIEPWRIGENESWLTDMAAQGLHLCKLGYMFARFQRGEARQMLYRIDFPPLAQDISEEQRQLCAEAGWEHVCGHAGMQVFRSPQELDAPELHSDPAEQALAIRQLQRRTVMGGIIVACGSVAIFIMLGFALFFGKTPLLSLVEGDFVNMPLLFLLYAYLCYTGIQSALAIGKLSRDLREGRPVNHRADWRRYQRLGQTVLLIVALITPITVGLPFMQIARRHSETLPPLSQDQTLLRLADIEQNPLLIRDRADWPGEGDWLNFARYEWSPYARTILTVDESGLIPGRLWQDGSGAYSPSINYGLYQLRFPSMAQGVLDDLCRRYKDYSQYPIIEETGHPGFERLFVREQAGRKELFAARGGTVIYVRYYGEEPLEQVLKATGEWLARL